MRFRRGMFALVLIGSGGLAAVAGCSVVTSYEGFTGTSTATCGDRVPSNTAKPAGTPTDKGPLVGAAQTFRFLDDVGAVPPKLGLDLDENCVTTACEPKAGNPRALGPDNVLGAFISQLQQQQDLSILALKHGTIGLVVEVSGWNGTDNDDAIAVSVFNVAGVNGAADGGAQSANDGNDVYIARDTDLLSSPVLKPLFTSSQAYVTKKRLAARFAQVRVRVIAPTAAGIVAIELAMVDAALVGTLSLAKGGIEMPDAQLVGRVRDIDILRNLSQLGLCSNSGQYSAIKSQICGVIDLTDSRNTDGKRRPCTSGSIAIGLAVAPAKLATATAPAPVGPYQCASDPPDNCGGR
jgi:hypothetical protein